MPIEITQIDIDHITASFSKLYINDVLAKVGDFYDVGDHLKMVADRGKVYFVVGSSNYSVSLKVAFSAYVNDFYYFTGNSTNTEANYTVESFNVGQGVSFNIFTKDAPPEPILFSLTFEDVLEATDNNATLFIEGVEAVGGEDVYMGDSFEVIPNEGYKFYNDTSGDFSVYYQYLIGGVFKYAYFEELDEFKRARLNLSVPANATFFQLSVGTQQEATGYESGANKTYIIENEQLQQINAERFERIIDPSQGGQLTTFYDYGQYILSVLRIPFKLSDDVILDPEYIKLGDLDTSVKGFLVSSDRVAIDLGLITIDADDGNLLDYKQTEAFIYLPYAGRLAIDINLIMGKTITSKLVVSLYDGVTTVLIHDLDGLLVLESMVDLGFDVPYAQRNIGQDPIVVNNTVSLGADNEILKAYIQLEKNKTVLVDGVFSDYVEDEGLLSGLSGFSRVSDVELKSGLALSNEVDEIKRFLSDGVFFNA